MSWRRAWQAPPVFLLESPQDRGAWGVYSPEGHKESDTTEDLTLSFFTFSALEIREHLEMIGGSVFSLRTSSLSCGLGF